MGRPVLNSCCRCGTLKTGTIITGVLGILLAIATICFIFLTKVKMRTFILQDLDPFIDSIQAIWWPVISSIFIGVASNASYLIHNYSQEITGLFFPKFVKIILVINLSMTILISALLIVGALKRNRFMMLPWLILAITTAVGLVISILYSAICLYIDEQNTDATVLLITGLIVSAVTIYLWLVCLSFYQKIYDEKSRGPYQRPPYQYNKA